MRGITGSPKLILKIATCARRSDNNFRYYAISASWSSRAADNIVSSTNTPDILGASFDDRFYTYKGLSKIRIRLHFGITFWAPVVAVCTPSVRPPLTTSGTYKLTPEEDNALIRGVVILAKRAPALCHPAHSAGPVSLARHVFIDLIFAFSSSPRNWQTVDNAGRNPISGGILERVPKP
jgi:hypothetical protein